MYNHVLYLWTKENAIEYIDMDGAKIWQTLSTCKSVMFVKKVNQRSPKALNICKDVMFVVQYKCFIKLFLFSGQY